MFVEGLRPEIKFPVLFAHLALKEAQHTVCLWVCRPFIRIRVLFYCFLPHNASSGMLTGSSLALKSLFSLSVFCINSIHRSQTERRYSSWFLILVSLVTVSGL